MTFTRQSIFAVLCDKTTDSSHHEQLCICLRFVNFDGAKHTIREEFLDFQSVTDLTGEGLANKILSLIRLHGLDPAKMVGQGYDGASSMSGCFNGVQKIVRDSAHLAVYVHCASHVLNFVLNTAASASEV